jgi:hypothetical protein
MGATVESHLDFARCDIDGGWHVNEVSEDHSSLSSEARAVNTQTAPSPQNYALSDHHLQPERGLDRHERIFRNLTNVLGSWT